MDDKIKVALVDDHLLLRTALVRLLNDLGYSVIIECSNGKELINILKFENLPDVILMDISMPEMNGFETTKWLTKQMPPIKVIALTMYDDENSIIQMLKNGARGYILKDAHPNELKHGINEVVLTGFYFSELVSGRMIKVIQQKDDNNTTNIFNLSVYEIDFLKLLCTELTYKEIADKMNKSPRTIDGYRDNLFEKLGVKNRIGLAMFALKKGFVHLNE